MSDKKIDGVEACSNHGCVFGHPGGMGTNGQCHCLDIRPTDARIRATRNVLALRAALTAERERADRADKRSEFHHQNHLAAEREIDALRERVARLVGVIEAAPHGAGCLFGLKATASMFYHCNCWKRTALGDK